MKTFAIIPSGGTGSRFGGDLPKQYVKINGKELIAHTLEVFQQSKEIDEIIIAAQPEYFDLIDSLKNRYNLYKVNNFIEGGATRQASVANALFSINAEESDLIAVHDAARPLLPINILNDAVKSAKLFDSVVVAIKARDTILKGKEIVEDFIDRNFLWYAQTPQVFKYNILYEAVKKAINENFTGTDESMLVTRSGYKVKFVEGIINNFKVTTQDDIKLVKSLIL